MAAPETGPELLHLVQRSGLVLPKQLDAFVAANPPNAATATAFAHQLVQAGILTPFQVTFLLTGRFKGLRLGPFRLLDRIGEGGMGEVYLAEHMTMRRRAAIKVLPPSQAADPGNVERFHREARAVAQLNHPNIVRAFDIGHDAGVHYLALEYIQGRGLHELIKEGPIPVNRAANYIAQAALGLHHAYENGLVHRDIKPANLLVDTRGVVRVLDLGLARFFHDTNDNLTRNYDKDMILGTVDYIAPEQAHDSSDVDVRADIYSLGVTFYELLTGKLPFKGSVTQKIMAHQRFEPRPVRELRPEVPPEMADVVVRMMAKDPDDRFSTPGEVAHALQLWSGFIPTRPASVILATGGSGELPVPASGLWDEAIFIEPAQPRTTEQPTGVRPRSWHWALANVSAVLAIGLIWLLWRASSPLVPVRAVTNDPVVVAPTTFPVPKEWYNNGFATNPYLVNQRPLWAVGCIWPPDPTKAENYRFFPKLQPDHRTFLDPANSHGGHPHGTLLDDAKVSITSISMRTEWQEGKTGPRFGTLTFIAPVDGVFTLTGRAFAKRWEGEGAIHLVAVRIPRRHGPVERFHTQPISNGHSVNLKTPATELAAGGYLVLVHELAGHHSQGDCHLAEVVVTREPLTSPTTDGR